MDYYLIALVAVTIVAFMSLLLGWVYYHGKRIRGAKL